MRKTPTKTIAIFFDEQKYKAHVSRYNDKLEAAAAVDREANRVLGTETLTIQDKAKAVDEFYKIVESINKDRNPMQLSGSKLVQLHGLETIQLDVLSKQFARLKDVEQPITEQYTIYASTPDELARYAQAATLTDAIRQLRPHFFLKRGSIPNFEIRKAFHGVLELNTELNELEPSVSFIKGYE
jgi:vacuolar-type H+-ATPase subunit I/STV1